MEKPKNKPGSSRKMLETTGGFPTVLSWDLKSGFRV